MILQTILQLACLCSAYYLCVFILPVYYLIIWLELYECNEIFISSPIFFSRQCFHFYASKNNTAVTMLCFCELWRALGYMSKSGSAVCWVWLSSVFLYSLMWLNSQYSHWQQRVRAVSPHFCLHFIFFDLQYNGCEVLFYCCFNLLLNIVRLGLSVINYPGLFVFLCKS